MSNFSLFGPIQRQTRIEALPFVQSPVGSFAAAELLPPYGSRTAAAARWLFVCNLSLSLSHNRGIFDETLWGEPTEES